MSPKDAATLVALSALWGGSFLFIRVAVPSFGPVPLAATRVVLGAVLLAIYAAARRKPLVLRPYAGRLLILSALNAAVPFTLIAAAELELTSSFAAVLNATAPLFAALLGVFLVGERFTPLRVLGLLMGVAGVAVMVGWSPIPLTLPVLLGVAAMLAGSASYAAAGFYVRMRLAGVPTQSLALGQQLGALVWLAVPAVIWAPPTVPPPTALGSALALGVFSTAVAYLLYFRLIERVGPTKTATVTYLLPVFGLLWGSIFLDEPVSGGLTLGLLLVLTSMVLVNEVRLPRLRRFRRAARVRAPAAADGPPVRS